MAALAERVAVGTRRKGGDATTSVTGQVLSPSGGLVT